MKKMFRGLIVALALLALSTLNSQLSTAFAQGSLTPPGAPAPTMKSLDQIEARTAITNTASLVTIAQPGSYYLTHNLTVSSGDGIDINTNGVTLDLNGFTISSTAGSATGYGISLASGLRNITIANGFIQGGVTNNGSGVYGGGGFGYGIYFPGGTTPENVLVSRVSISGCLNYGIFLNIGNSTVVEGCTVRTAGSYGIYASTVKNCSALDCGASAINGDQVSDCRGQCSGGGFGLSANTALNCYGQSGSGFGLSANTALNCYGQSSSGTGLSTTTAQNCYGYSSSSDGLDATTAQNCYGFSGASGVGLDATTALNCYGQSSSGTGLSATTAQNCYGYSSSGSGIYAERSANNCYGYSGGGGNGVGSIGVEIGCNGYSNSGLGINTYIANSCVGATTSGTTVYATYKYNMP
jgi:hypothetical protein